MENLVLTDQHQTPGYSKWGILSFLISLVIIISECLSVAIPSPGLVANAAVANGISLFLIYCILPGGCILGMGFGLAGLIEKNQKRLFSVLGLIINLIAFLPIPVIWMFFLMVGLPFCLITGHCGT